MVTKNQDSNFDNLTIGQPTTNTTNRGDVSLEGNLLVQGSLTAASSALTAESVTGGNPSPASSLLLYKAVPLTSANILAMNATPVQMLPAPGAGKVIVIQKFMLRMTRTSTQYANGGTVTLQYATGPVAATGTVTAATVTGAAGIADYSVEPVAAAAVENDAIQITNGTAPFITGTGTGVAHIWYSIV